MNSEDKAQRAIAAELASAMDGLVQAGELLARANTPAELSSALKAAAARLVHRDHASLAAHFRNMADDTTRYSDEEARATALQLASMLDKQLVPMADLLQDLRSSDNRPSPSKTDA